MASRGLCTVGLTLFLGGFTPAALGATADPPTRAELANDRGWRALLHADSGTSDIDSPGFFLSPAGKENPRAELDATVSAFERGEGDAAAACRFPARFSWLDRTLHLSAHRAPPRCPALELFLAALKPHAASVLYASSYLENPTSAFGHAFLRLRGYGGDLAIDFSADANTRAPLPYAWKGLTGGFPGRFRVLPFAEKAAEYTRKEGRDLWEYELALTEDEVRALALHVWELRAARVDYYYLTENCSSEAILTLHAIAPRLGLRAKLHPITLPSDAIGVVASTPGLVVAERFEPSWRRAGRGTGAVTLTSAEPGAADGEIGPIPWGRAPHAGHEMMRVTLGGGGSSRPDGAFASVGYRLALHDLADPPAGRDELTEVQFLEAEVRYDPFRRTALVDEVTFADVTALRPLTAAAALPSFRLRAYGDRIHDRGCPSGDCFAHGIGGGVGGTLATSDDRLAVFALADASALVSGALSGIARGPFRVEVGPLVGVRVHPRGSLLGADHHGDAVALVTLRVPYLPAESLKSSYEVHASLRGAVEQNVAVGIELASAPASRSGDFVELALRSYFYF